MATAGQAAVTEEEEDSDLTCPVCHDVFTHPKVLPCGHLLCHQCLLSWGQSQPQTLCPLCKRPILGPQDANQRRKFEDVVEALPTDLAMEVLVKCQQLLEENRSCQACMKHNATSMCLTCGDFYCTDCAKGHTRMSVAKGHIVEEMSTLTPEKVAASLRPFCSAHPDEVCKVYCSAHKACVCMLCATTSHCQCQGVKPIEQKATEGRVVLEKMVNTLTAAETQIDEAVKGLNQHLHNTKENLKTAVADIGTMRLRLESAIKDRCQHLENMLKTECSSVEGAVNDGKACLLSRKGKLTTNKGVIQRAQGITSPVAISGMASSVEAHVNDLDCSPVLPTEAKVISKVTLVIDHEAISCIERQLAKLGQIKIASADGLAQRLPFRFHNKHGEEVLLSNDNQTAMRIKMSSGYRIALSAEAMQVELLHEIKIDRAGALKDFVYLGVVAQVPDKVNLRVLSWKQQSAVVVHHNWITVNGAQRSSTVGAKLAEVGKGSTAGLALDKYRGLHLFIDGKHQGLVASGLPSPCYFMVDLQASWETVTTLPVRHVRISE